MQNLEVRDAKGQVVVSPVLGHVKIYGPGSTEPPATRLDVQFGDLAKLAGYDVNGAAKPDGVVAFDLHWDVTGKTDTNYTVFVHLLDAQGKSIANNDGPPLEESYPTSYWEPGEQLLDSHAIALPGDLQPGTYSAIIGLYDPVSGARVAATGANGEALPDNAQPVEVRVAGP
jgi:hypothetical protein